MKRMMALIFVALAAALSACMDSGGGGGGADLGISCADVRNGDSSNTDCTSAKAVATARMGKVTVVDAGVVSRGSQIEVAMTLVNSGGAAFTGTINAEFDAGCGGAPTWAIVDHSPLTLAVGESLPFWVAGECGDMPTGSRQLTAWAEDSDGVVVDQVKVMFELTE